MNPITKIKYEDIDYYFPELLEKIVSDFLATEGIEFTKSLCDKNKINIFEIWKNGTVPNNDEINEVRMILNSFEDFIKRIS